jgi:hypothetical protein
VFVSQNRRFEFQKRSQFFVGVHNETLPVAAMRVSNPVVRPLESMANTQPQLQPALLRLSAMICQDLTAKGNARFGFTLPCHAMPRAPTGRVTPCGRKATHARALRA